MSQIHIVTDSAASLPIAAIEHLPISIVPMYVQADKQSLREGVNIDSAGLYDLFRRGILPSTSQPAPGDFLEIFQPLVEQGKQVLAILVTSKASGTCDSARIAADMLPKGAVTIFDSASTGMGTGWQAIAAAEAALAGRPLPEIVSRLEAIRSHTQVRVALPTLKYLQRSGRVNLAQALLGGLLNIKVILSIENGEVLPHDKVRSWQGAVTRMVDAVQAAAAAEPLAVAVHHTDAPQAAADFYAKLHSRVEIARGYITELSAALGVHGGPGMLGVVYFPARLLPS
ncbi:MAG: DegV family protein [Firmicutes bacterium]|nr:DegV family protein [Bacillota bacterium]